MFMTQTRSERIQKSRSARGHRKIAKSICKHKKNKLYAELRKIKDSKN